MGAGIDRTQARRGVAAFVIAFVVLTVAPAYAAPDTVYDLAIDPSFPSTLPGPESGCLQLEKMRRPTLRASCA
jgi:hypothetical protein